MAVIWGIPYLLIKIAVGELTPVTLAFLRTALGAALLLPIAPARRGLADAHRSSVRSARAATTSGRHAFPACALRGRHTGGPLHRTGLLALLRADRRGRTGAGDRHHLLQPGGRAVAGRDAAARTPDDRGPDRSGADSPGIVLRHAQV